VLIADASLTFERVTCAVADADSNPAIASTSSISPILPDQLLPGHPLKAMGMQSCPEEDPQAGSAEPIKSSRFGMGRDSVLSRRRRDCLPAAGCRAFRLCQDPSQSRLRPRTTAGCGVRPGHHLRTGGIATSWWWSPKRSSRTAPAGAGRRWRGRRLPVPRPAARRTTCAQTPGTTWSCGSSTGSAAPSRTS